ncbi:MAG: DUF4402 domain-containing protein [Gemmatimonadales bacterium]|nr:DUF4402 domain-containing protein [Gemmatimonadales bacterium]
MRNFRIFTILALVALSATGAQAFVLDTTAAVEVVEGIVIAQTTGMDFGQVADKDGVLVMSQDATADMTDADGISFDPTGYTPGIFTVTAPIGATVSAVFADAGDVAGLGLSAWTVSNDGGTTPQGDNTAITQLASDDTWYIGATLTVTALTAVEGAATPGYSITVTLP